MTQFIRTWRATVGTLRVSDPMRIAFEIERTLRPQPNKCTLKLWNLTNEQRAQIESAAEAQVIVEAGYVQARGREQLFRGELHRAHGNQQASIRSDTTGLDIVTHVEARDAGRAYQRARISRSFEPGVTIATVLRALAEALGVGPGNLGDIADLARLEVGGDRYPEGTVLSGQAAHELTRILAGLGLRWSVQHGALQILREGQALRTQAVLLSSSTGLKGHPEPGTRGRVKVTALLSSDLWPGRSVVLRTDRGDATYVCRSVIYRGDSHAKDWDAECELAPPGAAA